MKIAIFNWRDVKNPKAGGAEVVTHEIAKRWVNWGNEVTLFTASFPGAVKEEYIDGVKIVRQGGQLSVRYFAFFYYRKYLKGKVDVVIDEINTIPFFTPFFVKEKKVVYFNQLAREVWFYEAKFPLNLLGFLLEPFYLKIYRNTLAMVISESTKKDVMNLGVKEVSVFPMAIYFEDEQKYLQTKEKDLTLIFVGRMVKSKRPDEVIKACGRLKETYPNIRLWLVGGGDPGFIGELKELVKKLGIEKNVEFLGFLHQDEKFKRMSKAHIILVTSIREGWGLIVTEANALKTPAVVYDVPGLRDAVHHNETGLVVTPNHEVLAAEIKKLWEDTKLYQKFQDNSFKWSRELTWDRTAEESLKIIKKA